MCDTARYEDDKRRTRSNLKLQPLGFEEKENLATTPSIVANKGVNSSGKKSRASQLLELGTKMHVKDVNSMNDFDHSEMKRRKKELTVHSDDEDDFLEEPVSKTSKIYQHGFGINEDNVGVRNSEVSAETPKERVNWKLPFATSSIQHKSEKEFDHFQ